MKIIKMQNSSVKEVHSGVYKITFPNNKIYIGISNNMYRRMLEHNTDRRNNLPIEHAVEKYGKITEFEILEEIAPENRSLMCERERYWIQYYDATNPQKGYNISCGGDGAYIGSSNGEARFTEEEIMALYEELKNNLAITLEEIAKKYGVSISTISHINNGITYYHSNISYPIRSPKECRQRFSGVKSVNSYLTQDTLDKIYRALIEEQDKTMKQLAQEFGVSSSIIQNINSGRTYYSSNFTYPLRKPKAGSRKLSQEQVKEIIFQIQNFPKKSLAQIGQDLKIHRKTISAINCGTIYKQKNLQYPIRHK